MGAALLGISLPLPWASSLGGSPGVGTPVGDAVAPSALLSGAWAARWALHCHQDSFNIQGREQSETMFQWSLAGG